MDNLFDRAHDIIDKAQGAVATATAQAAWTANQGLVIRNMEGRVSALQTEVTRVTARSASASTPRGKAISTTRASPRCAATSTAYVSNTIAPWRI